MYEEEESVDQLLANLSVSLKVMTAWKTFIRLTRRQKIENKKRELQEREERWKLLEQRMDENLAKVSQKITLDVGGKKYTTSKDTLMSIPNTYFTGLLGSGRWKPEADGSYFIDRDRKLFHYVLQLLRTGEMSIETLNERQKMDLKRELEYYLIPWPNSSDLQSGFDDPFFNLLHNLPSQRASAPRHRKR
ncbi:K+ channel tetramerization domain-containing protein [Planoprotostelium fungivorum]|uniref:K+ channel tetramerization domain-containing protein n=1 Tax=Planoprotostelium fungivorum TaxID=1890364 RepID=A0A2P6NB84_9EUKA|nr:K+ channel tetramerization domain-containing protein [Planoprotostelium fungivorum]